MPENKEKLNERPLAQIKDTKMKNRQIVEIIGLLSVIGSLIFVGFEINQNTAAIRGATQQEVSNQVSELYKLQAENEKIAFIASQTTKGIRKSDLSETDYQRFWGYAMVGYRRVENIYLQYKNGFLSKDAFSRIGIKFYRRPLLRDIWEDGKHAFDLEFVIFFEELRDNK